MTRKLIWKTIDGKFIYIVDMDTQHIINSLRMIYRNPGRRTEYRIPLILELTKRNVHFNI